MEGKTLHVEKDVIVMAAEHLDEDVMPEQWLQLNNNCESEKDLANALAGAWNQFAWLSFDCNEPDCPKETMDLCDAWYALEEKMEEKVKKILQEECPDEPLEELSSFQMLAPFMERNGYINGCGWWVENEDASD